ncbi:hypothetical protein Mapa_016574 [Marchantia paleacea]|nr:hypothetical protein Mapa_016574 [Marchantia paleacea]
MLYRTSFQYQKLHIARRLSLHLGLASVAKSRSTYHKQPCLNYRRKRLQFHWVLTKEVIWTDRTAG